MRNAEWGMRNYWRDQKGVSIIAAIFIIVILAFMGVMFVSLIGTGSLTSINDMQSTRALFVAEGGMERAVRFLLSPTLTERGACGTITGNPALTNTSLTPGQFTVIGSQSYSGGATLSGAIGSADTTINVSSTAGYASFGRILIDREAIDYNGTTAGSFTGAVRGRDGTTAVAHANGTRVGHYQCAVTSTGGIPDLTTPLAQRAVAGGMQLQGGFAVGNASGGELFATWNGVTWSRAGPYGGIPNNRLNSVSMLSYADVWAVGDPGGNAATRPLILWWNGNTWVTRNSNVNINRRLNGIYCVASNDCWAVGNPAGGASRRPLILWWNGAAWSRRNSNLNINQILDSVHCTATNNCWAVGDAGAGASQRPLMLWWNGAVWATRNSNLNINEDMNSVFCVTSNDCWAVGTPGGGAARRPFILWWNGANWSTRNSNLNINSELYSVHCAATDDCWAVGRRQGGQALILHWNGAAWSRMGPYAGIPNAHLRSVYCVHSDDCWALGNASGGELIIHWDGNTWSRVPPSPAIPNVLLRSIYIVGPRQQPRAGWQEVIN